MTMFQKCTSKRRRDVINDTLLQIRDALPLTYDVSQRISQLQTMSLACVRLRKTRYFSKLAPHSYESICSQVLTCPFSSGSLCKALSGFILVMTNDGKLIHISENVVDYLGHNTVDLLSQGDSLYDIIDRRDHRDVKMRLQQQHQQQQTGSWSFLCRMSVSRNLRRRTGLGESRVIHVQGRFTAPPGSGADAKDKSIFIGMCLPLPSISQNKQSNSLLPDDVTLVCRVTLSQDLTFIDTDPGVTSLLGYEPDWLLGQTLYNVVHPSDVTTLAKKHQLLSQSPGAKSVVMRLVTSTGDVTWANVMLLLRQAGVVMCTIHIIDESAVEAFRTHNLYSTALVAMEPEFLNSTIASASNAAMEVTIVRTEGPAARLSLPIKSISCDYPSCGSTAGDWQQLHQVSEDGRRSKSHPCLPSTLASASQHEASAYAYDSLSSTLSSEAGSPSTYAAADFACNDGGALVIDVNMSPSSCYSQPASSPYSNNVTNIINVANNVVYGNANSFPASPADSSSFLQELQQQQASTNRRGSNDSYLTNSYSPPMTSHQTANFCRGVSGVTGGQMQNLLSASPSVTSSMSQQQQQGQWCQAPMVTGSFVCIDSNRGMEAQMSALQAAQDAWCLVRGGGLQDAGIFQPAAPSPAPTILPLSLPTCSSSSSSSHSFPSASQLQQQQQPCFSTNPFFCAQGQSQDQGHAPFNCLQAAVYAKQQQTLAQQQQASLFAGSGLASSLCQPQNVINMAPVLGGNSGHCSGRMDTQSISRPLPGSWACW